MKTHMPGHTGQVFLATLAAVCLALGLIAGYVQFVTYDPPYVVVNPELHYARQLDQQTIEMYREFRVTRDTTFHIDREIVQTVKPNATVTRIELPGSEVYYPADNYRTKRIISIPLLPPGKYEIVNRVCWPSNLIRIDCLDIPRLSLELRNMP